MSVNKQVFFYILIYLHLHRFFRFFKYFFQKVINCHHPTTFRQLSRQWTTRTSCKKSTFCWLSIIIIKGIKTIRVFNGFFKFMTQTYLFSSRNTQRGKSANRQIIWILCLFKHYQEFQGTLFRKTVPRNFINCLNSSFALKQNNNIVTKFFC